MPTHDGDLSIAYYRGEPETLHAARRTKRAAARQRSNEEKLTLRQSQLPLEYPGECR